MIILDLLTLAFLPTIIWHLLDVYRRWGQMKHPDRLYVLVGMLLFTGYAVLPWLGLSVFGGPLL